MPEVDAEAIRNEFEAAVGRRPAGPPTYEVDAGSSIDHVIGVVSGKGGVGKSFVTGLLAIELARRGYAVGVLDADITGPSIPKMLGLSGAHAFAQNDLIIPVETAGGIKVMSANLVLEHEDEPVIWRGPILAGTLRQFFGETDWGKLDYLLVDMPPGTGDVPLTAFQSLPLEGVVIVSSPQDLVQMVVGKAYNMAAMMDVPVIGLVENMAYVRCPHCGDRIDLYGPSHLAETAAGYGIEALGQLPIDPALASACDAGTIERDLPEGLLPQLVDAVLAAGADA